MPVRLSGETDRLLFIEIYPEGQKTRINENLVDLSRNAPPPGALPLSARHTKAGRVPSIGEGEV
jgi:hypothetical protein